MPSLSDAAKKAIDRCPHCGNRAGLEASPRVFYRCRVCGGPRVPSVGAGIERSHRENEHLKAARRARRSELLYHAAWIATGVVGGVSLLMTLLALLLFSGLFTGWAGLLAFPALPVLLSLWARKRTRKARETRQEALDQAWASVAHEILEQSPRELTSADLAHGMLTSESHADRLLARLNVDDQVRSRVTDDGQIGYSVRSPQRVRVSLEPDATLALTEELELAEDAKPKTDQA